jgi:O-methyltransferase
MKTEPCHRDACESPEDKRGPVVRVISLLYDSLLILRFVVNRAGREYGVGRLRKLTLARRIMRNSSKVESLSSWQQHLVLVEEILRVPKSVKGDVVECGCFNGATTVNLSLACALTKRRLFVCDSFEGLPRPEPGEEYDINADTARYRRHYRWEEGEFASHGGLDGVKRNVERLGDISVCQFVKGYYENTLKDIDTDSIAFVFEDADLASSVRECLRYLWPKLQEGCRFYSHEPEAIGVVSLFYDNQWWRDNMGTSPPGFFGSGRGIVVASTRAMIGYAEKFSPEKAKQHGQKIVHSGSRGYQP